MSASAAPPNPAFEPQVETPIQKKKKFVAFNYEDALNLESRLTEEEIMVRDTCRHEIPFAFRLIIPFKLLLLFPGIIAKTS